MKGVIENNKTGRGKKNNQSAGSSSLHAHDARSGKRLCLRHHPRYQCVVKEIVFEAPSKVPMCSKCLSNM